VPIQRFMTVESAGDYIWKERAFDRWTVLVQEANKITAGTPYRQLNNHERLGLERKLYPSLFEDV